MAALIYESTIKIMDYCKKIEDLVVKFTKDVLGTNDISVPEKNDIKTKTFIMIEGYGKSIQEVLSEISKIKDDKIFDTGIRYEFDRIVRSSHELTYCIYILDKMINCVWFEDYGRKDCDDYLRRIFIIAAKIDNLSSNIKFSDFCYVERGLIKKEDIYPNECNK